MRDPSPFIKEAHHRVAALYAPEIGKGRDELSTPALLLDLATLRANLERMEAGMRGTATALRAHVKVHKSPHIARLEIEHGAIGIGCATVWEAIVMAQAGIDDVFVINEVMEPGKARALALLAREVTVKVAVDDPRQVDLLSAAAKAAATTIGVLIDVDEGMHRCGVTTLEEALPLARRIAAAPGLEFFGLTGYEGHCSLEFDEAKRHAMAGAAMGQLTGIAAGLAAAGLPCRIVSAAGTGTWEVTSRYPGVTEIQPGSYATMDGHHRGLDPRFGWAVTVLATVISRRSDRIVTDAGSKTVGASRGILKDHDLEMYRFDEEHSIFLTNDRTTLQPGDKVEILCNYTPFAISYFEGYHVMEDGRVTDIWPVMPRGPESRWLLDMLERGAEAGGRH